MIAQSVAFEVVGYDRLDGWAADDHGAAFEAFIRSCKPVLKNAEQPGDGPNRAVSLALLAACQAGLELAATRPSAADARRFFETNFTPHCVVHGSAAGLLTGYYEPLIEGSRTRTARFGVPVLRRPADLVNLVAESQRGAMAHQLTHARKSGNGIEPYATREEIEHGALEGQGLELVWLEDPVDAFFLHVQGSGQIRLPDGELIRITYDGKNGHPYSSVGRWMIDTGQFPFEQMSLQAMKVWLRADRERGKAAMRINRSYVFFRELSGSEGQSALGVLEIPLTPGRSLAVDTAFHVIGTPVFVSAPSLTHANGGVGGYHRLMVAQDVGSAIRGPERGDLYFGSGDAAGQLAGVTKHEGKFVVLLPSAAGPTSS